MDEDNAGAGWIRGYGVVRMKPWHLAGLFPTQAEAEKHRKTLGNGNEFVVRLGSRRLGTDDFIFSEDAGSTP
jgi:hypothetical protein